MSDPFIGEIRMFPYSFAPRGWAYCLGQEISIQANTALYAVIGTIYGGNGRSTMGLPNLQGRAPVQQGQSPGLSPYFIGALGGQSVSHLDETQLPKHSHGAKGSNAEATSGAPDHTMYPATSSDTSTQLYTDAVERRVPIITMAMANKALAPAGDGKSHENRQPFLTIPFCIALEGTFPFRN